VSDRRRRVRASSLCVENGNLLLVRLLEPETQTILAFPPGGEVEPGELPEAAAARETLEETGYQVEIERQSEEVTRYPFRWDGREYDCTTHFFLARKTLHDPQKVTDPEHALGNLWLPLTAIREAFQFHPILQRTILSLLRLK